MKKVIKLTEKDLTKIITKILKEDEEDEYDLEDYNKADDYASELIDKIYDAIDYNILYVLESMNLGSMIKEAQYSFRSRYPEYASTHETTGNEHISFLMELSHNPDLQTIVGCMLDGMNNCDGLLTTKE